MVTTHGVHKLWRNRDKNKLIAHLLIVATYRSPRRVIDWEGKGYRTRLFPSGLSRLLDVQGALGRLDDVCGSGKGGRLEYL